MNNIGIVLYTKGKQAGTLEARWWHQKSGSGTGLATEGPVLGYAGEYVIDYFDSDGAFDERMALTIAENIDFYDVIWKRGEITACVGIGRETSDGLVVAWRGVND